MFSALYCTTHDQGAMVSGDHDVLPTKVDPCQTGGRRCDYRVVGRVRADATDNDLSYDRIGGGWQRSYFAHEVYEADGRSVECPGWLAALVK